ncbi:phospholipase [Bacteroidia bacterium]|nr:phospholipase [Bacteroidia bacterium]
MKKTLSFLLLAMITLGSVCAQQNEPPPKIGIVLSGGAARGFAHLGALQALHDAGIYPSYVAGASMGAVIGSVYASGMQPAKIYAFAQKQNYVQLFTPSLFSQSGGLSKTTFIRKMLDALIDHNSFDSLKLPFYASITNLDLARDEIKHSGDLKTIVCASSAVPLVFVPVKMDGYTYVDGGTLNNLPVDPLLQIADCRYIIGVSVVATPEDLREDWKGIDPAMRAFDIMVKKTEMENRSKCHFFLEVEETSMLKISDFNKVDSFYEMGYKEMSKYIRQTPELEKLSMYYQK